MNGFTPWRAQPLDGRLPDAAQQAWLQQLAEALQRHLHLDRAMQAVGECLERLLSGLPQAAVSIEEACRQQGLPGGEQLVARHNEQCLTILDLLQRHRRGEAVGPQLLHCLHG